MNEETKNHEAVCPWCGGAGTTTDNNHGDPVECC
jgi:hypothetical protein